MSGMGHSLPYIKNEPIDEFDQFNSNGFTGMNNMGSFNHSQQFGHYQNDMSMQDMSDVNMHGNQQRQTFGGQQNISSSFMGGNSAFADDELADLVNYDATSNAGQNGGFDLQQNELNNFATMQGHSMNQQGQFNMNDIYSQTPDGPGPIQSPFNHQFNYAQYMMQPHAQSPMQRPSHGIHSASFDMGSRLASLRQERQPSANSKSPMTPKTPNATSHMMGKTPDASSHPTQPISGSFNRAHQKTPSNNWDTIGSVQSYMDSPLASPRSGPTHPPITDVLGTSKKSEGGSAPASTLEAKRQKRRQSHNAVERRRRDNINDRIQELAKLVPAHRLDDDRVQKHLKSNNPFPPQQLGSISPPQASSLLAGGTGKRALGSVSSAAGSSLPLIDEKDKGPAKGDVLNGAVSWTRDLMWILHRKMQQESILIEKIQELGGDVPFQTREDEARMQTELMDAIARNGAGNFDYSRGDGSGLFVPGVTDHAGNRLQGQQGGQGGGFDGGEGFGMHQNGIQGGQQQFWTNTGFGQGEGLDDFKEEEEFEMQL